MGKSRSIDWSILNFFVACSYRTSIIDCMRELLLCEKTGVT
jgi:hypothetical protein